MDGHVARRGGMWMDSHGSGLIECFFVVRRAIAIAVGADIADVMGYESDMVSIEYNGAPTI